MGLFSKLFARAEDHTSAEVACAHRVLTPRWDRAEDIGAQERATGFRCESCGASFSGDEGRALLARPSTVGSPR